MEGKSGQPDSQKANIELEHASRTKHINCSNCDGSLRMTLITLLGNSNLEKCRSHISCLTVGVRNTSVCLIRRCAAHLTDGVFMEDKPRDPCGRKQQIKL